MGENRVLAEGLQRDGGFPLRERVDASSALQVLPRAKLYDAAVVLGDYTADFIYFAASVFWRAGAREWTVGANKASDIDLGNGYLEQLRRFLLGEEILPPRSRFFLHVSTERGPGFPTIFPCSTRQHGTWRHKFYIPGLLFTMFLGGEAASRYDLGALNSPEGRCVWLAPWEEDSLFRGFVRRIRQG
jgi:hypothetical protein